MLEREHNAIDAEFVRNEFEKVSREVETAFSDKARVVAEFFGAKVDEVFGAEDGHLAKEFARLFGDGSSSAVHHQLRQVMLEQSARMREDLLRQFSSADGSNPLADFKAAHLRAARDASTRQEAQLEEMREQMVALKLELAALRSEREKASEVAAEDARSTAKGRPYEEAVAEAVDVIARGMGDDCEAVGDFGGAGGRKGDVVVDIDGCSGSARGRIVLRGQALAQVAQGGAGRARGGDGPALRRLRRLGRALRGPPACPGAGAARGGRRQAVRGLRPRGGSRLPCRSPTRSPGRGC